MSSRVVKFSELTSEDLDKIFGGIKLSENDPETGSKIPFGDKTSVFLCRKPSCMKKFYIDPHSVRVRCPHCDMEYTLN